MGKKFEEIYYARRKLEPDNDMAVPAHRVAYRKWYCECPWVRTMMKWRKVDGTRIGAPEMYGYKRVSTYQCEIDQDEAQKAVMVIALKKAGLTNGEVARGMAARYGQTADWWKWRLPYILNGYKYYVGRHLVYNADGEVVYPPFMEE